MPITQPAECDQPDEDSAISRSLNPGPAGRVSLDDSGVWTAWLLIVVLPGFGCGTFPGRPARVQPVRAPLAARAGKSEQKQRALSWVLPVLAGPGQGVCGGDM